MSDPYYVPPSAGKLSMSYQGVDAGVKSSGIENPLYTSCVLSGDPHPNFTSNGTGLPPPEYPSKNLGYPPSYSPKGPPPPAYSSNNLGYPPGYPPSNQPIQQPGCSFHVPLSGASPPPDGNGKDDEDDPNPTAPSMEGMPKNLTGYEHLSFEPAFIPPPTYEESEQGIPPPRQSLPSFVPKRPDEVRDILFGYISEQWCYGTAPARDMVIQSINMTCAFHYKLETLTEKREMSWKYEPYDGQSFLDGPTNGPVPSPWSIPLSPPAPFTDGKMKVEVPHTAILKMCHACGDVGRVQCRTCMGIGGTTCFWCNGCGCRIKADGGGYQVCTTCSGTGSNMCLKCSGSGMVKCKTCEGLGHLKCFVQLTATWKNNVKNHVCETGDLPVQLIYSVTGVKAFEETMTRVSPINHFPSQAVNDISKLLIQHSTTFKTEKIVEQRHSVEVIPVSVISYIWNGTRGEFFIYGLEERVHFPDYPSSCCWSCHIS